MLFRPFWVLSEIHGGDRSIFSNDQPTLKWCIPKCLVNVINLMHFTVLDFEVCTRESTLDVILSTSLFLCFRVRYPEWIFNESFKSKIHLRYPLTTFKSQQNAFDIGKSIYLSHTNNSFLLDTFKLSFIKHLQYFF